MIVEYLSYVLRLWDDRSLINDGLVDSLRDINSRLYPRITCRHLDSSGVNILMIRIFISIIYMSAMFVETAL